MFGYFRRIGFVLLFGIAAATPAHADGSGPKFKLLTDEATKSPDRQLRVEQYSRNMGDDGFLYQFWTFDNAHKHGFPLNPDESTDLAGYPAGFRFSPDSQWLVRMQKLGAGYHTLLLYRRQGNRFVAATSQPVGQLAWDYFLSLPVSKGMLLDPKDRGSITSKRTWSREWKTITLGCVSIGPAAATP